MRTIIFENPIVSELKHALYSMFLGIQKTFNFLLGEADVIGRPIESEWDLPRKTVYSGDRFHKTETEAEDACLVDPKTIHVFITSDKEENDFYSHMRILSDDINMQVYIDRRKDCMDQLDFNVEKVKEYRSYIVSTYKKALESANEMLIKSEGNYLSIIDRVYKDFGIAIWPDEKTNANFLKIKNIIVAI